MNFCLLLIYGPEVLSGPFFAFTKNNLKINQSLLCGVINIVVSLTYQKAERHNKQKLNIMKIELVKTYYSVPQNGLFENFFVKIDGECLFSWGDNSGLIDHSEAGGPLIEERLKSLPPEIGQIYSRMKQAEAAYGTEWEKADGHDVLARDGRKDEFGAEWVLLLN